MNKAQEEKDQRVLLDNHQRGSKKFMFIVAITLPFIIAGILCL